MTPDARGQADAGASSERLRALLARAAEEQLSEQRQISAVLAELRALVVDLGDRLAGVEAELDELGGRLDELGRRVDATAVTATAARGLVHEQVADCERRVAAHVDDAVLALAGVLLRRPRGSRAGGETSPAAPGEGPAAPAVDEDGAAG